MIQQITTHPVPLALREFFKEQSDGQLRVVGSDFTKKLFFRKGQIVHAQTTVLQERLGEILFKLGKIDQTQFWNLQKLIDNSTEKIGKILVNHQIIDKKDIFFGLLHQMRTIALSLFQISEGSWEITPLKEEIDPDLKFQIEITDIIPEGVKKIQNMDRYKALFADRNLLVQSSEEALQESLSPDNRRLIKEISIQTNQPARSLVNRLQLPEDILWQKLIHFYLLNLIDFVSEKPHQAEEQKTEEKPENREIFTKINQPQTDYYDLLGVQPSASSDQIKEAYFSLAKRFHPDRLSHSASEEERDTANTIFARINKAYETLSNDTRRKQYDQAGFKDEDPSEEPGESPSEKARRLHRKAKGLYNQKKFWEAAALMEEAVRQDSQKGPYYLLLGLCQMYLPSKRREAENSLQKASEMEPWNAEPLVALGKLFLAEQLPKRAVGFFQRALSIDSSHAVAKKKLEETLKKSGKKRSFGSIFRSKKS